MREIEERQGRLLAEAKEAGLEWWPAQEDLVLLDALAQHEPSTTRPGLTDVELARVSPEGFVAVYSRLVGLESYGLLDKEIVIVPRPDIARGVTKGVAYWRLTPLAEGLLTELPQAAAPGQRQRLSPLAE